MKWLGILIGTTVVAAGGYVYYQHVWKPKHVQKIEPVNQGGGGGTTIIEKKEIVREPGTVTTVYVKEKVKAAKEILNTPAPVVPIGNDASFNGAIIDKG